MSLSDRKYKATDSPNMSSGDNGNNFSDENSTCRASKNAEEVTILKKVRRNSKSRSTYDDTSQKRINYGFNHGHDDVEICDEKKNKIMEVEEKDDEDVDESTNVVNQNYSKDELLLLPNQTQPSQGKKRSWRVTKEKTSDSDSTQTPSQSSTALVKDHTCSVCHKVFLKASDIPRHMTIHTGEIFKCEFCDKRYAQKTQLTRHIRDRHWKVKVPGSKGKPQWRMRSKEKVQCKFCDKLLHRCSVVRHVRNVHLKEIAGSETDKEAFDKTSGNISNTSTSTNHSDKVSDEGKKDTFSTLNDDDNEDNSIDDSDTRSNSKFSSSKSIVSRNKKTISTKSTDTVTGTETNLVNSKKTMTKDSDKSMNKNRTHFIENNEESLDSCEEKEGTKMNAESDNVKTEGRLWKCPVCGIIFIHISELKIHLTIHTGELPYTCRVCPAQFAGREKFVEHCKVHQNRKESKVFHVCCVCNKTFTRKSSYLTHTLLVHKRERKFQCDLCGKAYGDRKTLRLHHRRFHVT